MPRCDAAKKPKLFVADATAALPLVCLLVHPSWFFFYCLLAVIALLWLLERRGMTLGMLGRALRMFMLGGFLSIRSLHREKDLT